MRLLAVLVLIMASPAAAQQPAAAQPWLGIAIDQGKGGIAVLEVIPGTPAEQVGMKAGDVIVGIDGSKTPDMKTFRGAVGKAQVGDVLKVDVRRGKERVRFSVTLQPRPSDQQVVRDRLLDREAPAFALPVIAGKASGKLADHRGKVVVVEFWATWCRACRATHADLAALQKSSDDIVVLGISAEDAEPLRALTNKTRLGFTVLHDTKGDVQTAYWGVTIPTLVVIDRAGVVRYVGIGAGPDTEAAIAKARELARAKAR